MCLCLPDRRGTAFAAAVFRLHAFSCAALLTDAKVLWHEQCALNRSTWAVAMLFSPPHFPLIVTCLTSQSSRLSTR